MSTTLTAREALLAAAGGTLAAGTDIRDTATTVADYADALQGIVGSLGTIFFTDGGRPSFAITPSQLTADAGVIALISPTSPYFLEQRITAAQAASATLASPFKAFRVVDFSDNVIANLAAIETLWQGGHFDAIRMTDPVKPFLHLSAAQVSSAADVLSRISRPVSIVLTDSGVPTITLPPSAQTTPVFRELIGSITTPFTLQFSGFIRSGPIPSAEIGIDRVQNTGFDVLPMNPIAPFETISASTLPGGLQIIDYQGTLTRTLESLTFAAQAGKVASITLRDPGTQVVSLTPQQATDNAAGLALFSPNLQLSQIISATQAASPPALDSRFFNYTVEDSFANIMANVSAIDALGRSGQLPKVRATEPAPDMALSAAQLGPALYTLSLLSEIPRIITLTDSGTPTITVNADILSNTTVRLLLAQIPNTYQLTINGRVAASVATTILSENTKVLSRACRQFSPSLPGR